MRLKRAFLTNSSGIMASRVLGFLRDLSMANFLGAGLATDIFFVAFKFPNLFRRIFGEGAFTQSFLPSLINASKKGAFCIITLSIFSAVIVALSLLVLAFSPFFTRLIAFGFEEAAIALAAPLVAINFWYLLLVFFVTFFSTLLQYRHSFWASAYNTTLLNIAMIAALFLGRNLDELSAVYMLSYGVLAGGFLQILLHVYPLYALGLLKMLKNGAVQIWLGICAWGKKKRDGVGLPLNRHCETSQSEVVAINSAELRRHAERPLENPQVDCHDPLRGSRNDDARVGNMAGSCNDDSAAKNTARLKTAIADTRAFFAQFFPALLGSSTAQIASFIDTLLASFLATGAISYLYYANRIFQLPLAVFAIAVSTALFPSIAKAIKNGAEESALKLMKKAVWFLTYALAICAVGGVLLSREIIFLLYEHGKFSQIDATATAWVFAAYLIGLLPFGITRIFSLYLYATMRQKNAAIISAVSLLTSSALGAVCVMAGFSAAALALSSSVGGFVLLSLTAKEFGFRTFFSIFNAPKLWLFLAIILLLETAAALGVKGVFAAFMN